jgi:FkbM family methyltransferase
MTLQQAGRHDEAAALCRERLRREPRDADAQQMLAATLLAQGRTAEGLECLAKAAALVPGEAHVHETFGHVRAAVGQIDAAIASYRQALALKPDLDGAAEALVALLQATGAYEEAEDRCRESLARIGDSARRRHALAGALFEQGHVDAAIGELEASLALDGDSPAVGSDRLRALNYADGVDPAALADAHREWSRRHADPLTARAVPPPNDPDPGRRLRVGYVSPYFRRHAVTFFLESVIEHHDRDAFELVLYADVPRPDEYSARLQAHGALWRSTVGADDETLAAMVREDGIDILVDLSGHTPEHRLLAFARAPAPVQATWNGYPNTTGMAAIGYRITDARCDPPGHTERFHSERLVRLPDILMSWRPPQDAPDPGPAPAAASGSITFGSFNACYKITPTAARLWSRVLDAVPGSRLVLFTVPGPRARERLRALFASFGIGGERLEIRPRLTHEAFLEAHREIDIALDSFPFHGTTTTCFSLWMGVPVVSLAGAEPRSRVGSSLLSSVGLADLAAGTPEDYVRAATRLAGDIQGLGALRSGMRARLLKAPLTDGAACARALERAYRDMWGAWCSQARGSAAALPAAAAEVLAESRNVIANTDYGPVIVNRHDTVVGHWMGIDRGWEKAEIELMRWAVSTCYGREAAVEILDIGANVGSHTIAFARFPFARLTVHAFEPQSVVFRMLGGTIALNRLDNVRCYRKAASSESGGIIEIPAVDYDAPGDFGSLELEPTPHSDFVGERIPDRTERIETVRIDDLGLTDVRLIKIDTEGMEHKVFAGAASTLERSRPVLFFEYTKTDFAWVKTFLRDLGYRCYYAQRPNVIAIPGEFPNVELEGVKPVED